MTRISIPHSTILKAYAERREQAAREPNNCDLDKYRKMTLTVEQLAARLEAADESLFVIEQGAPVLGGVGEADNLHGNPYVETTEDFRLLVASTKASVERLWDGRKNGALEEGGENNRLMREHTLDERDYYGLHTLLRELSEGQFG